MKTIKLLKLQLENFKGIKELEIDFENSTSIYGANASGKTTILDAFTWLLFDKDSTNKKDFAIKTLDTEGNVIHKLNHVVTAVLNIDGEQIELSKKYMEKWTKSRGKLEQELTSHTTEYYIDEIKKKANEYKSFISELLDEELFKLITNPLYFNEQFDWKKRRAMLIKIAGDVTDAEVMSADDSLKDLSIFLGKHSIEDKLIQINEQRKNLRKRLELIPELVNEATKAKQDTTGLNPSDLTGELKVIEEQIQLIEQEKIVLQNGGIQTELNKQKANIELELTKIKANEQKETQELLMSKKEEIFDERNELIDVNNRIGESTFLIQRKQGEIATKQQELIKLGKEWDTLQVERFDEHRKSCPTCGQDFPAEHLNSMIEKFNQEKAEKIKENEAAGKSSKAVIEETEGDIAELSFDIKANELELNNIESKLEILEQEKIDLEHQLEQAENSTTYIEKQSELEMIEEKLRDEKGSSITAVAEIQIKIDKLNAEASDLKADLAKFDSNQKQENRIHELEEEAAEKSAVYNELEKGLYLIEQFNKAKCNLLEDKINSKFKYVSFKLFKIQINGGIDECCETIFNGVPYNSGLNNAARINGGLDIINALTEHVQVLAPIFVDNRESVTELIHTESQLVSLIVSESDENLRVEA
ncbi:AAA family ATPase [Listeria monocytogenes]|uniref:ATP-binding protein n=1 Tax=Listeria monocytogenes TaxID=1639 RepID=UPI0011EA872F|nr:AAA family ATPase [Listeria monocytogenes]EDO1176320.1 AAA family ATPase [Listeria innocua]ECC2279181.1 AAA family ATPase [Listeria monocytogenes]ECC2306940.1 AAA family ATPase [Listeria monocytogenes]ECC2309919.1 AAA family ATPase [Listeria monocytogenes]ECC2325836.1 AAA family ATPase [Listeria monocytogenes]